MGKNLKGKELGVGLSQRSDGLYVARFTKKSGKRITHYSKKLQECRQWLADAQYDDEHGNLLAGSEMTLNMWFDYWLTSIKCNNVRLSSQIQYKKMYNFHIKSDIGEMLLSEIKPLHCQNILNKMSKNGSKNSTITFVRSLMHQLFIYAIENDLIKINPVTRFTKCSNGKSSKKERVLTVKEQKDFIQKMMDTTYYNHFAFVLQTGLRVAELRGLKWSDVDFKKKRIHVNQIVNYLPNIEGKDYKWVFGDPKTDSGKREIPLTDEAIKILLEQQKKKPKISYINYADLVFLGVHGTPISTSIYNNTIQKYCNTNNIPTFSMHTLRHTFATRCIEGGMNPKTLQNILGHSKIEMTMNKYVHSTDEQRQKEMKMIENILKVV